MPGRANMTTKAAAATPIPPPDLLYSPPCPSNNACLSYVAIFIFGGHVFGQMMEKLEIFTVQSIDLSKFLAGDGIGRFWQKSFSHG